MAETAAIYLRLVGGRIRADWQYRTSFVLFTVGQFLAAFVDFLAIAVIFGQIDELAGWTIAEVALLYGLAGLGFSLADVFVSPVEDLHIRIRAGTFDRVLIRPVGALLQLAAEEFAPRRAGKVVQAAVILGIALAAAEVDWDPGRVVMVPVTVGCATVIFGSLWVMTATLAFWTTEGREVANSVTYGGNFLTQYPIPIYGRWLRRLLAFIVPLAFVAYYPALYILDRDDPLGAPGVVRFVSPLVALVMVLVARAVWGFGVRRYRSTGS